MIEVMTLKQVADYYGTGLEAIASLVKDNREELLEDGLVNASGQETKEILAKSSKNYANERGYFVCDGIKFNHRNNLLFPRRAILRVGMLLRDSEVAKEVRTQLLNIEEKTSDETKTHDIDEEQSLMLSVGMAVASGDATAVAIISLSKMDTSITNSLAIRPQRTNSYKFAVIHHGQPFSHFCEKVSSK